MWKLLIKYFIYWPGSDGLEPHRKHEISHDQIGYVTWSHVLDKHPWLHMPSGWRVPAGLGAGSGADAGLAGQASWLKFLMCWALYILEMTIISSWLSISISACFVLPFRISCCRGGFVHFERVAIGRSGRQCSDSRLTTGKESWKPAVTPQIHYIRAPIDDKWPFRSVLSKLWFKCY